MQTSNTTPEKIKETVKREKSFYNSFWQITKPHLITGTLEIPEVTTLSDKRVLICSCGAGYLPVQAAKQGAEVFTFDISEVAIEKAKEMAEFNNVLINARLMDFHALEYPENFFDVIYGSMILHHIYCSVVSREIYKCLKINGIACFTENSDRNPILRFFRKALFGKPGEVQKNKFLFFRRGGTLDEYPLTDEEIGEFEKIFGKENIKLFFPHFVFFECFNIFGLNKPIIQKVTRFFDSLVVHLFPYIRKYSFLQTVWMRKQADGRPEIN